MLAAETDKLIQSRLEHLEHGVERLDVKVTDLGLGVQHLMEQNQAILSHTNENHESNMDKFRAMREQLEAHSAQMTKSIRQIKRGSTTRCQVFLFGATLVSWTFFMAWMMFT